MALPVVNQNHIKNYVTTMLPSKFIKKAFVSSSFNQWFTDFLDFCIEGWPVSSTNRCCSEGMRTPFKQKSFDTQFLVAKMLY